MLKIPTAHTGSINSTAVSPDGKYIATASSDFTIKLWDYRTKKELKLLTGHTASVNAICFSPDGQTILSGSNDAILKLWNVRTGDCIATIDSLFNRRVNDVCFSDDGKKIAGCSNNLLSVLDLETKKMNRFRLSGLGRKLKFYPGGNKLACAESDSSFSVWSLTDPTGWVEAESFSYAHGMINDFFIGPDGQTIFCAVNGTVNNIRIHNNGRTDSIRFTGHLLPAKAICPGENADLFYSSSEAADPQSFRPAIEIKKWSISQGRCIDSFYISDKGNAIINNELQLTAHHELAISNYQTVFLIDKGLTNIVDKINSRTSIVNGISVSDSLLYFSSEDGVVRSFLTSNNSLNTRPSAALFTAANFTTKEELYTIQRTISKNDYCSYIIKQQLKDNHADTLLTAHNTFIRSTPGIKVSPDGNLLAYTLTPVTNGSFTYSGSVFMVYNTKLNKNIYSAARMVQDVIFLTDNKSWVYSTGNSNKLYLYNGDHETILQDTLLDKLEYYSVLELLDSNHIIASNNHGFSLWNISTGRIERKLAVFNDKNILVNPVLLKLSPKKDLLLLAQNDSLVLMRLPGFTILQRFPASNAWINQLSFADTNTIVTSSIDNSIRAWNTGTGKEKYRMIFIDSTDWIIITPEGYYQCTPAAAGQLHYVNAAYQFITFEQLDVKYNRPDKVLEAMGNTDTSLIKAYREAYEKRIRKLGIDTLSFRSSYGMPITKFVNAETIAYEQQHEKLTIRMTSTDSNYKLDRLNVWINHVPIYGQKGISIRSRAKQSFDTVITLSLSAGINSIEASVTNVNGTESYRMPVTVRYTPAAHVKERVYFIGIGIDQFADNRFNLQYSSKDIRDLCRQMKTQYGSKLFIDTLFNQKVTIQNIRALKQKLQHSGVNDKVIIAYSGHGLLSKDFDYYLSTYGVNFEKPEEKGLPYEEIESLVDNIPARKKLLLIDACHSGEVDREDLVHLAASPASLTKGLKPVAFKKQGQLGLKNSFELMQELFVHAGKSTGAVIMAAAAGTQFALETNTLKNGVFTYCILSAMRNYKAMKLSALKKLVGEKVVELTNGLQQPTSRKDVTGTDWDLW